LPLEFEFGNIVFNGGTLQHHLFLKKEKLAHRKINLNVVDPLLHLVAHVETTKDAWDSLCVYLKEDMLATYYNYNPKMDEGTLVQAHINKLQMTVD
jgi:hypothetical protein